MAGQLAKAAILTRLWVNTPVPAPDRCSLPAVQAGAIPPIAAFEVADPALAAGAPLDQLAEAAAVLDGLTGSRNGLAGDRRRAHARSVQVPFDGRDQP
jgi:hypothetical protein